MTEKKFISKSYSQHILHSIFCLGESPSLDRNCLNCVLAPSVRAPVIMFGSIVFLSTICSNILQFHPSLGTVKASSQRKCSPEIKWNYFSAGSSLVSPVSVDSREVGKRRENPVWDCEGGHFPLCWLTANITWSGVRTVGVRGKKVIIWFKLRLAPIKHNLDCS